MIGPLGLALLGLLAQVGGAPYERTRVDTAACRTPVALAACLHWEAGPVNFQQVLGGGATPDMHLAVTRALGSWRGEFESCGNLELGELPPTSSRQTGYAQEGENVNSVIFRDRSCRDPAVVPGGCRDEDCGEAFDCWNHQGGFIAVTTSTYGCETGVLYDTDIEVNAHGFELTTVDAPACVQPAPFEACACPPAAGSCVLTDVENTVVHELGHALGLDHTRFPESTMAPVADPGETHKRDLDPGSREFVCEVHARGAPTRACVVRPLEAGLGAAASGCAGAFPGVGLILLLRRRRRTTRP